MGAEIFEHVCIFEGCPNVVHFDDEPWCSKHTIIDGTHLDGYSARKAYNMKMALEAKANEIDKKRSNIFDQEKE